MNPILSLILCVVNRAREDKIEFHDIYYEMCLSRVICAFAMSTLVSPRTRKPSRIDKKKNVSILCRYMFVQDAKIEASSKSRRLLSILSSPKLFESIISGSSSIFDVDTMNHLARFGCRCNFSILVHTYSGIFNTRTPTGTVQITVTPRLERATTKLPEGQKTTADADADKPLSVLSRRRLLKTNISAKPF